MITQCKTIGLILFFLSASISVSAQFNTLKHIEVPKQKISFEEIKKNYKEDQDLKKVQKKKKYTKEEELKREIDSLKMLLIKYGLSKKTNPFDFKKIEDSILKIVDEKMELAGNNFKNKIKTIEPIEDIPYVETKISMPLNKLKITSGFGTRSHPIFGKKKMHNGVDFAVHFQHVHAVLDGIVTEAGWDSRGGGNYVKILHSGEIETSYLHLSQIYYKPGEHIKAGWIIARSGNSGNSTGPHLHFAVKEKGKYINPISFLNDLIKVNNLIAQNHEKQQFTN